MEEKTKKALRIYVVVLLSLAYCFNFIDRQIVTILQVPLKAEFGLSDTQLGVLTGFSFALFYALLGIPIARIADRLNRVNIISISIGFWSVMTALSGLAGGFWSLAALRVGVGVGEAGCTPPSHSIISDYFNKTERSRALSIYSLGQALGGALGVVIGGVVAQYYGWRVAFFIVGIPGILLAFLVKFTVPEPKRGAMDDHKVVPPEAVKNEAKAQESIPKAILALFKHPSYRHVAIGHVIAVMSGFAFVAWLPPLISRTYGLPHTKIGVIVGVVLLFGGAPGMVFGGFFGDFMAKRFGMKWLSFIAAIGTLVSLPLFIITLCIGSGSLTMTIVVLMLATFIYQFHYATSLSLIQSSVISSKRALATASLFLFSNFIGMGMGPLIVGAISDHTGSLRLGMAVVMIFLLVSSFEYYRSARFAGKTA